MSLQKGAPQSAFLVGPNDCLRRSRRCCHRDRSHRYGRRSDGSCPPVCPGPDQGHRRSCRSIPSRVLGRAAADDNPNRRRDSHRRLHSSDRRRIRDARRHSLARNNAAAARNTWAGCNNEEPNSIGVTSNTPQTRKRSGHKDDSCHTRTRCCSRCYRPAACRSLIRSSLRNILRETKSSIG
jgi:hypothetical protein